MDTRHPEHFLAIVDHGASTAPRIADPLGAIWSAPILELLQQGRTTVS